MKTDQTTQSESGDIDPTERFVDAVLHEQSRNGSAACDEPLVELILAETVRRPSRLDAPPAAVHDRSFWLTGAAAVAAVIAAVISVLSILPFRSNRSEEEVLFVVQYSSSPAESAEVTKGSRRPAAKPGKPYRGELNVVASPVSSPSSVAFPERDLELTTIFGQSIEEFAPRTVRRESFRIVADHTAGNDQERVYSGNVVLFYGDFEIRAEVVRVAKASHADVSGRSLSMPGPVTASEVTIQREAPFLHAVAASLRFDPVDGSLTLSKISDFSIEEQSSLQVSGQDRIVISTEGFEVISGNAENANNVKYANPLPLSRERK